MNSHTIFQKNICHWWRGQVSGVWRILLSSTDSASEFQLLVLCLDALGLRPHLITCSGLQYIPSFPWPCVLISWSTAMSSGPPSSFRDPDLASCVSSSVLSSLCPIKGQRQLAKITPGTSQCQMESWVSVAILFTGWLTLPSYFNICPYRLLDRMPHPQDIWPVSFLASISSKETPF